MRLEAVDYKGAGRRLEMQAGGGGMKPTAVAAYNTRFVALAIQKSNFGKIPEGFDLLLPNGVPLVWAMRAQSAKSD